MSEPLPLANRKISGALRSRLCVLLLTALAIPLLAQEPQPPPQPDKPRSETRFSLSVGDEGGYFAGLRTPLPEMSNLLLVQPSFAYRYGDRFRFHTSLAGIVNTYGETHARLRVKETYASVSAGDFDVALGKKILRWGTGYAFTPTGVLDAPRAATDPTDRLGLNEGREMAAVNWIRGRHSVTAAWATAGLVERHRPWMRETTALRYNTLAAGFDASAVFAHDRGGANFIGANFTRVFGESVELHGELARRRGDEFYRPGPGYPVMLLRDNTRASLLLGGKYTHRSGVGAILEFYSAGGLVAIPRSSGPVEIPSYIPPEYRIPTERRNYLFVRLGKSRLRELPGWKEWDVSGMVVANVSDNSRILILDAERRIRNRFSFYVRGQLPAGKRWASEYGMIPYAALLTAGFRLQL